MPQFLNLGFTFDGISGEDVGYYIVNASSSSDNDMGLKKEIQEEDNNLTTKTFLGIKLSSFTFTIDIVKMPPHHREYTILEITEKDINFLNNWLLKPNDYRVFSSDQNRDVFYYAMFTDMKETRIGLKSYLTLTMRLNSGFAYSSVIHHKYSVENGLYTSTISTKSTVDDYIYPDIYLEVLKDTDTITITNITIGESMTLTNIPKGKYICYNEDMKHIDCISGSVTNLRPYFNNVWLRLLGNGVNHIMIEGTCEIDIYFQNKIAIQH